MTAAGRRGGFAVELARALEPLGEAASDPQKLDTLLRESGLDQTAIGDARSQIEARIEQLESALQTIDQTLLQPAANGETPDPTYIDDAIDAFGTVFKVITSLDEISVSDPDIDRIGELLLDYLLIDYLAEHHVVAYSVLSMLGVTRPEGPGTVGDIDLSRLGPALSDPNTAIQDGFDWGSVDFEPYLVLFYLKGIVGGYGLDANFQPVPDDLRRKAQGLGSNESWPGVDTSDSGTDTGDGVDPTDSVEDLADDMLVVDVLSIGGSGGSASLDLKLVPVPPRNNTLPGFAVVPDAGLTGEVSKQPASGWTFNADISAESKWIFRAMPERSGGLHTDRGEGKGDKEFHGEASLTFDPKSGPGSTAEPTPALDDGSGSGIDIRYFQARVAVHSTPEETRVVVEMPLRGRFRAEPSGGFLGTVMPEGIEYDFDTTVGWASDTGLYLQRGGTLEASVPMAKQLGPMALSELYTSIDPGGGGTDSGSGDGTATGTITFTTATSGSLTLGPVTATVRRVGVEADVDFPEGGGAPDVEIDFRPPTGVGLSIDQGAFSGGGYLQWDPEGQRYAGSITVKTGAFTISAVGLLTTELPDGGDGFSLLVVLSGEFPPVQLGMGFTLNGVGGIIGVNRGFKHKPLGTAITSGQANSVLMPDNPKANSRRLISDLGEYFPSRTGSFVIGPMAQVGWAGELITADLGLVIELPSAQISLLGVISSHLPSKEFAILKLNMGISGVLDIPNSRVAIDASIFDSRIVMFSLKGDMALRANWGSNPRFILSVGGFHPRYSPPGTFPDMERVTATLGGGGNPRIELTGYFAVTSNTLQGGAKLYAVAEAGPAKVEGHLGFDALIQYNPFKFVVDVSASLSVTVYGYGLSIGFDGRLAGPAPFRVSGTITIEILFISISPSVSVTIGEEKSQGELPRAKVLPKLVEELNRPGNWTVKKPDRRISWASLRDVDTGDGSLMAHPLARIGVRQTVVPFQFRIERFGQAKPAAYTKFRIRDVSVGGSNIPFEGTNEEQFSPSQFLALTKSEKLDMPSFRAHPAGRTMRHEDIYCGYPDPSKATKNSRTTTFGYECMVIDRAKGVYGESMAKKRADSAAAADGGVPAGDLGISGLAPGQATALTEVGAVANSPARTSGTERFRPSEAELQATHEAAAGVAQETRPTDDTDDRVVRGGDNPDIGGVAESISMSGPTYVVVDATDMRPVELPTTDAEMSKAQAMRAKDRADTDRALRVVPSYRARGTGGDR